MAKVSGVENALCGLAIFILAAGFIGSIVMVIVLAVWQQPTTPGWAMTNPGEVYYGVEVTYNDLSTVWQDALYQTTSMPFQTWTKQYCDQMATIMGSTFGRQYGSCTVISFRPNGTNVLVQYRIGLLVTAATSNLGCAARKIFNAISSPPPSGVQLYKSTTNTKVFNIPVPPTTANMCQYTSLCRASNDICQVSQSMPAAPPTCSNINMTLTCNF